MSSIMITSNVANRLRKIREGIVYSDISTFVLELIQNAQRAKATIVNIESNDDYFSIEDNGGGCANPAVLFTLDVSGFGVGFGEGFNSIFAVADSFTVTSRDWEGSLNVVEALEKEDLSVAMTKIPSKAGFKVELRGEKILEVQYRIQQTLEDTCSIIPDIEFIVNGKKVQKRNLFDLSNYKFNISVNNRMYEGQFALTNFVSNDIKVYNEYRYVTSLHCYGVIGFIQLKPNTVDLRVPDRRSIVYNDKRTKLENQIANDVDKLCLELMKKGDYHDIKEYSNIVESHLNVTQYIKYLTIPKDEILNQYEVKDKAQNQEINRQETEDREQDEERVKSVDTYSDEPEKQPVNNSRVQEDKSFISEVESDSQYATKEEMETITIQSLKGKQNVVWIELNRYEDKADLIAKYEYYGIFTFVSPHILYDKALSYLQLPHIDDVKDQAIKRHYNVKRIGAINKKEQRATEILNMIEKSLGLPETFYISDIHCRMVVSLHESKLYQERLKVEGYAQGETIHLNRKSLNFGKLSSLQLGKDNLGIHDIKFILSNLVLIAHELAHVVYCTQDNTISHYQAQDEIQKKIAQMVSEAS